MFQIKTMQLNNWFILFIIFSYFINLKTAEAQSPIPEDAKAEYVVGTFQLCEGPYWHPNGYLLFSDVWSSIIYKWDADSGLSTFLSPPGQADGIAADLNGNIIICQHQARQVGRIEDNGTITPLATLFMGDSLHSPNDLAVKSDGAIFFTDPPWGGNPEELNFDGVYRIPPQGGGPQLLLIALITLTEFLFPLMNPNYMLMTPMGSIYLFMM